MIVRHAIPGLREARTWLERFVGLMFEGDSARCFMLFEKCTAIHTMFMRLPIDVVFISEARVIQQIRPSVGAWRMVIGPDTATATVELPSGYTASRGWNVGDQLEWQSDS